MALLPAVGIGAISAAGLSLQACWLDSLDFATTGLAAGFHRRHVFEDMLLRNAEVQYVCRNAARQSHGSQIRGPVRHRWLSPAA
jgi:hypothetical protein